MKISDEGVGITANRRAQMLRKPSDLFARNGLQATTTLALAQAAGISEADRLRGWLKLQ